MKNLLTILLSLVFCALFPFAARPQTIDAAKQELAAIYARQDQAYAARDAKTLGAFYAPGYVADIKQGTVKRAEALQNLQKFFETTRRIYASQTTLEKVEQIEGTYVAFISRQITGLMIFAGGKTRSFELKIKAEEQWAKTDKGIWLVNAGLERSQNLKVEGESEIADTQDTVITELEEIYDKLDDEFKAKNFRALVSYWAADYTETQDDVVSQRDQVEKGIANLFARINEVSNAVHQINEIKTAEDKYRVESTRSIEGVITISGKKAPFAYSYQVTEYWIKNQAGVWEISSSEILGERFVVDGKVVK